MFLGIKIGFSSYELRNLTNSGWCLCIVSCGTTERTSANATHRPVIRFFQYLALLRVWEAVLAGNHSVTARSGSCRRDWETSETEHADGAGLGGRQLRKGFLVKSRAWQILHLLHNRRHSKQRPQSPRRGILDICVGQGKFLLPHKRKR